MFDERDIFYINAGFEHSSLITNKNEVYLWGDNSFG